MKSFALMLGVFALVVMLMAGLYVSQSVLAREYGVRVTEAVRATPVTTRRACREAFPAVRPRPLLVMLRTCTVEPTPDGVARVDLTLTDGRSYRADVR